MPDVDQSLKIQITIASDAGGGREVLDVLKQITDASRKNSSATADNAENQRLLGLRIKDVNDVMKELGGEFPLLGAAAQLASNPFAGLIHLALMGFTAIQDKLREVNEELDRQGEKAAEPIFKAAMDARREATEKAVLANEAALDKMDHLIDAEKKHADAVRNSIALSHELAEVQGKGAELKHGADAELLKREFQDGLISAQQYYQQLTQLDSQYEQEKLRRMKEEHSAEIQQLTGEYTRVLVRSRVNEGAPEAARGSANQLKNKVTADEGLQKIIEAALPDASKALANAEENLKAARPNLRIEGLGTDHARIITPQQQVDEALAKVDMLKSRLDEVKNRLPGERSRAEAADREAARITDRQEKDKERAADLWEEIEAKRTRHRLTESAATTEANSRLNDNFLDQPIGDKFTRRDESMAIALEQQRVQFAAHVAGVKDLTNQQKQFLDSFENFMQENGTYMDRLLKTIADYRRNLPPPSSMPIHVP